jgi:hypothetical protein
MSSLASGKQEACGCGLIKGEEDHKSSFKKAIEKLMTPKYQMQGLKMEPINACEHTIM